MLNEWEPWACFLRNFPIWGHGGARHVQRVAFVQSFLCRFVLVAVTAETPAANREDVAGRWQGFLVLWWRPWGDLNPDHRHSCRLEHAFLQYHLCPAVDLLLAQMSWIHLVWWWMGRSSIPWRCAGPLELETRAQTLFKAKTGDCAPAVRFPVSNFSKTSVVSSSYC